MKKGSENSEKFLWVGNDPSIDFINTEIVQEGKPVDLIENAQDYLEWLVAAGIELRASASGRNAARKGLQLAKALRAKLRHGFEQLARRAPIPEPVITTVNACLDRAGRAGELRIRGAKFKLRPYWKVVKAAEYVTPVAWAFAEFLAKADLDRVRKCKNPECILFFYDTSKSGTRTWCSLDICGNKMRMAASRKRHQRD
ncbi:MAG: CGNR zinc finger domain-containing protein [Acidobacteriales bacterium]|nr:CGNR zinc finger domain-containing protein [Terriglobales bacterium]